MQPVADRGTDAPRQAVSSQGTDAVRPAVSFRGTDAFSPRISPSAVPPRSFADAQCGPQVQAVVDRGTDAVRPAVSFQGTDAVRPAVISQGADSPEPGGAAAAAPVLDVISAGRRLFSQRSVFRLLQRKILDNPQRDKRSKRVKVLST